MTTAVDAGVGPLTHMHTTDVVIEENEFADVHTGGGRNEILSIVTSILMVLPLITSASVQMSGLPAVLEIIKAKSTGDQSPIPFISVYIHCVPFALYSTLGILIQERDGLITALIVCVVGTISGIVCTVVFSRYTKQSMWEHCTVSVIILSITLSSPVWTSFFEIDEMFVLGMFGIISGFVLDASPLAVVGTVIQQKSTQSMPFVMSISRFVNSVLWLAYAWLVVSDFYIFLRNSLGLGVGIIQMTLFIIYPRQRQDNHITNEPKLSRIKSNSSIVV